jgi:hypothetical protein
VPIAPSLDDDAEVVACICDDASSRPETLRHQGGTRILKLRICGCRYSKRYY